MGQLKTLGYTILDESLRQDTRSLLGHEVTLGHEVPPRPWGNPGRETQLDLAPPLHRFASHVSIYTIRVACQFTFASQVPIYYSRCKF